MEVFKKLSKILFLIGNPAYRLGLFILKKAKQINNILRNSVFAFSLHLKRVDFPKIKVKLRFQKNSLKYAVLTAVFAILSIFCWSFYTEIIRELPNTDLIYNPPKLATKVLDRNGQLLYKFYDEENRSWTPINKIPQSLIWATLSVEDKDFFNHHGISFKGLAKAIIYNFKKDNGDKPRGGSTITQQLVKNVFFGSEKTYKRKIKEAILSFILENKLTKKEILERYFNQVAYGGDVYGVQEASLRYFGKNVWEINMAEATFLAGLPAAPTSYSPFGQNPELAYRRQRHVVDEMANAGFIDKNKADELKNTKIEIKNEKRDIKAPHFVFYIKNLMEEKYALSNFGRQGLVITTSLDLNIQKMAENMVREEVDKSKNLGISNGSALVIDPRSGDILAMVGSKDFFAKDIDGQFNVTNALRQPGSSIKPINYLLALKNGSTLMTVIDDSPVTYQVKGQKPYSPKNYNGKYMGKVTLKTALASSLNIPSVKLLNQNGVNNMIDLAEKLGINSWKDRSRFGLSLALGSGEVKMTELASAYGIFANLGEKTELNPVLKIDNYLGEVVYIKDNLHQKVIEPEHAFLINEALSDNQSRTSIFGANSKLKIEGKTVAVKTGTTNNLKDNWCIGWTPSLLVASWVGNNDGKPMNWVASGVSGATPIWNRIMTELLKDKPDEKWTIPHTVYKARVCGKEEYFTRETEYSIKCPTPIPTSGQ